MLARYEKRAFDRDALVWVGRYLNLHNIPHWHLENELLVCQRGSAKVMLDDQLYSLQSGMCLFCPSGSIHYIASDEGAILIVALFDPLFMKNIMNQRLKTPMFPDRNQVMLRLLAIREELLQQNLFSGIYSNAIMIQLIIDVFRSEELEQGSYETPKAVLRYKELITKISSSDDLLSFSQAAALMNMSEAYFSRYFKKLSGMTYSQHLNILRVDRAVHYLSLNPDITTTELMIRCDFNTLRNFNRVFKAVTGYAPRHLPDNFSLNIRSVPIDDTRFDPTLDSSILL